MYRSCTASRSGPGTTAVCCTDPYRGVVPNYVYEPLPSKRPKSRDPAKQRQSSTRLLDKTLDSARERGKDDACHASTHFKHVF